MRPLEAKNWPVCSFGRLLVCYEKLLLLPLLYPNSILKIEIENNAMNKRCTRRVLLGRNPLGPLSSSQATLQSNWPNSEIIDIILDYRVILMYDSSFQYPFRFKPFQSRSAEKSVRSLLVVFIIVPEKMHWDVVCEKSRVRWIEHSMENQGFVFHQA